MNNTKNDMPAANCGRRKIRNDLILIVSLVLAMLIIGACAFFMRKGGDTVKVTVDKKMYGAYPLSTDTRVEISTGENGEYINILVIKDGKAYVESANCPDGICSDHRAISHNGETIVCLPHKVVVSVYTDDAANTPDVIA